jgi:hypothetical protein
MSVAVNTMHTISIEQMKEMIKHVCFRLNNVVGFVGPSGCGKTEGNKQATEESGAIFLPFLMGQYDSVDLRGFPGVDTHDGYKSTTWYPASTLPFKGNPNFDENGPIINLFLDELNHANQSVLAICYQLMEARRIGEHVLMDNVRISCAMNRASDKGIGNRMPSPLDNRITWAETEPNIKDWSMDAQKRGVPALVIAFLTWQKQLLHTFNPEKPEKCFATGRSWVRAGMYLADTTMPSWLKEAAIAGSVGTGNQMQLYGFIEHWEKVTKLMPRVLKEPTKAEVYGPDEPGMQYAMALSISGSMDPKTADPYDTYLSRMNPEFRVMAWNLATARVGDPLYQTNAFIKFSKENKAIWQ